MQGLFKTNEAVTLVGAGDVGAGDIDLALSLAPRLFAADSGAGHCLRHGHRPEAVIGDLDSINAGTRAELGDVPVHCIPEQNSIDFDKALRSIATPLVIGAGFLGGRLDHALAGLNVLASRPDRRCILLGAEDVICLAPPAITLPLLAGTRVSLFPMAKVTGRSEGLRWEIDELSFSPTGQIGTSNIAKGTVRLEFSLAGMLLVLPRDCLGLMVEALLFDGPRWRALETQ